jgi:hypothetical protein
MVSHSPKVQCEVRKEGIESAQGYVGEMEGKMEGEVEDEVEGYIHSI